MDRSAKERVKNQRRSRIDAGWIEVRAWVPSKEDAAQLQDLAAKLRSKALNKQQLEQLIGVQTMDEEIRKRLLNALDSQGTKKHVTPSGPFLELLTELSKKGQLADISTAFAIFREAFPSNARFVANSIGAKILNHFFLPSLGLDGVNQFLKWEKYHPEWAASLAKSLLEGQFQHMAQDMLAEVKRI